MIETRPQIYIISEPHVLHGEVFRYLEAVKGERWYSRVARTAMSKGHASTQELIEFAGRLCYRSWEVGLNKNVTRIREDQAEYFENLLKSGHGSVLEHANYTFVFHNVSRVFTHELVRHRAGVAISQESLRYVRLTELGFRIPDILEEARADVVEIVEHLEEFQQRMANVYGLDDDGVPFHYKKEVTSALRRLAPLGLSTGMMWTANVRTIRHVLATRTAEGAEEEIRFVFDRVGQIMRERAPLLFQDFDRIVVDSEAKLPPAWVPKHPVAGTVRVS